MRRYPQTVQGAAAACEPGFSALDGPSMSLLQRRFVPLFVCLLSACASPSGSARAHEGSPANVLVSLCNYKSGERFELASESHTNRVDYYSSTRRDAVRKVQGDDIMSAFVEELGREGFEKHAQPGPAPKVSSGDVIRWGIEVQDGEKSAHWLVGTGSQADEWKTFQTCRDTFLQLYNVTVSYQAIENKDGKRYFDQQPLNSSGKPGKNQP